ncbi:MAG: general secretion pathway protein GspB [Rubrivivax sp.]
MATAPPPPPRPTPPQPARCHHPRRQRPQRQQHLLRPQHPPHPQRRTSRRCSPTSPRSNDRTAADADRRRDLSDQADGHFVVINGMVVREGETAAPGVMLERIGPKSAIVRWRDMRIELPIN